MAINLEEKEKLITLLPGVFQEDIKSMFYNAMLGLTEEGVVVYNDQLPDNSSQGVYFFKIRAKLDYSDIILMLIEEIKGVKGLIYKKKISFVAHDQDKSLIYFISKDGEKFLGKIVKEIKNRKIKIQKRKTKVEM